MSVISTVDWYVYSTYSCLISRVFKHSLSLNHTKCGYLKHYQTIYRHRSTSSVGPTLTSFCTSIYLFNLFLTLCKTTYINPPSYLVSPYLTYTIYCSLGFIEVTRYSTVSFILIFSSESSSSVPLSSFSSFYFTVSCFILSSVFLII